MIIGTIRGRGRGRKSPRGHGVLAWIGATALVACGGSNSAQNTYTVGVSVSGLSGSGLVLQLNMGSDLPVSTSGIATFATPLSSGASYKVSVKTQPSSPSQTCQVSNGTGTIADANVTGVAVPCVTATFGLSASVSGLSGSGLALQLNDGQPVPITANGTVTLSTAINSGASYTVVVTTQPTAPTQTCTVANGAGSAFCSHSRRIRITPLGEAGCRDIPGWIRESGGGGIRASLESGL
jgi:hypothetical protein